MKPYLDHSGVTLYCGDSREVLRSLPDASVNICVTSPPYWGLRDYGVVGQIGLEQTPDAYVAEMVAVFREVRRVLRDDGTLWLNLGDSYNAYNGGRGPAAGANKNHHEIMPELPRGFGLSVKTVKNKDLIGIPWLVAFALRADGWYLRSDIIWHKPNPMPESVTDRPTKAHEYLFLLSKSERYHYDADAIAEECESGPSDIAKMLNGDDRIGGKHLDMVDPMLAASAATNLGRKRAVGGKRLASSGNKSKKWGNNGAIDREDGDGEIEMQRGIPWEGLSRNKRTVWTVATQPYSGAHFATFPPKLIEPCILAGCPSDGVVLDPFFGAGTTGVVCRQQHVRCIGIELNPDYCKIAADRLVQGALFVDAARPAVPREARGE